jgi:hypothetical protein
MGIEGRDSVRRAREPRVEEADRRRVAARMRMRVCRRRGREAGVEGVPRRLRSWWEKVRKAGRREVRGRCGGFERGFAVVLSVSVSVSGSGLVGRGGLRMKTPPHCGIIQLVALLSFTRSGKCSGLGT